MPKAIFYLLKGDYIPINLTQGSWAHIAKGSQKRVRTLLKLILGGWVTWEYASNVFLLCVLINNVLGVEQGKK